MIAKPLLLVLCVLGAAVEQVNPAEQPKPNLIVIMADDVGFGDFGCYGATKVKTPHIDRLAGEGMRFTDAHTPASVCSPSRYGLMTGRYPWRLHREGNDYRLESGRLTLASMLKGHGYRSAAIGKWHLGYSEDWNRPPITGPLASEAGGVREKAKSAKADARAMGHATNGPLRAGKGSPFEGGHRVPFIARWLSRIAPGSSSEHTLCLTELTATAAEIVDAKLPENAGEDSFSFLPILLGKRPGDAQRKYAFIQGDTHDNAIAVRAGQWKLIETRNGKNQKLHQLYDLSADLGEAADISKTRPDVVRELAAALEKARTDGHTRN